VALNRYLEFRGITGNYVGQPI